MESDQAVTPDGRQPCRLAEECEVDVFPNEERRDDLAMLLVLVVVVNERVLVLSVSQSVMEAAPLGFAEPGA